ncbi:unnamed protein product [Paramecium pentaurelia]|uniref:Uncharacterized protein n=1 Tax=Paramecium pentaurelia TaxID=43138 RepID=A0A8S1TJH3_9CILI|nr:unnamed protein product [Paramecium pentaurelia]
MPQTKVGQIKKEAIYIFWFEFIGTFMLTFCIYASNNNLFVFSCAYGLQNFGSLTQKMYIQSCNHNGIIRTAQRIMGVSGNRQLIWRSIFGKFIWIFVVNDVPYLSQTNIEAYMAVILEEIFGSLILCAGFLFQYDDLMGLSSNRLEHSIIINSLYCVGRTLSYVAKSSLNPAIAFGLVFFECCKDGHWARILNLWIYSILPYFWAFLSLAIIRAIYRDCYEQQLQAGLRQ